MQEHLVDARWLEPPEPMELTLAALAVLEPGDRVRLLIHREPWLLFQVLKEWDYAHSMLVCDDGTYEVLIWRKDQTSQ